MFGGVILAGDRGSFADRLNTPTEDERFLFCAITDRRLLVMRRDVKLFVQLFDMPRQAIVSARRRTRILSRGRVALEFADSSSIALHAGFINAGGPAYRVARALAGR